VGVDNSYPYHVAGGLQDNGSHMGPSTKPGGPILLENWQSVGGGDGMYNVFDWKTNRYLYNESQFGSLQRIDLQTGERKRIAYSQQDPDMRWNWCAPILVSPHDSDVIYHCGNKVVKSPFRGEYWEVISPDLTTNDPSKLTTGKGGDGNIQYCTITTIDESPLVPGLIWVGTDDGNVQLTKDGGANWTKLNENITGNPRYWVSRVHASPHDPGTAFVSYTGYRRDDFRPFLYKTTDYGQTWESISSNLPDAPINVIKQDHKNPNLLFVGTEFNVYVSIDGGKSWALMKGDMPTQPVHDLVIHPRENDLVVATHGRGIFIADITVFQELSSEAVANDVHLFDIESKVRWVNPRNMNSSSANFAGESEPDGIVINYYLKNKVENDVKVAIYQGDMLINEITGKKDAGWNSVLWNMGKRRERSEEEQKRIKEMMARYAEYGYRMRINPRYDYSPAQYGEYRIVLKVGDKSFTKYASILKDHWYNQRCF